MTWSQWIQSSGAGMLFGFVWAWFWVFGRINQQQVFYRNDRPNWMRVVTGMIFISQDSAYKQTRFTYIFPMVIAILGFIGSMIIFQLFQVLPRFSVNVTSIVMSELSFPFFMIVTALVPILIAERKIKKDNDISR